MQEKKYNKIKHLGIRFSPTTKIDLNKYASIETFTAKLAVLLAVLLANLLAFKGFADGRLSG
jgi:hypothetical protein